jgi:DNA repair protein RadA/Sms
MECGTWGTVDVVAALSAVSGRRSANPASRAVPISSIEPNVSQHRATGIDELDRVLGGGVVPGSVMLLAGDPGVGKSTLLLMVAHLWAQSGRRALYISGEESAGQIRLRADRIGCGSDEVYLAAESDVHTVLEHIATVKPALVIVDSVQTMSTTESDGVAGGVTQVRAVTATLTAAATSCCISRATATARCGWSAESRTASAGPTKSGVSCCTTTELRASPIRPTCSWISGPPRSPAPRSRSPWTANAR